jgi:thiosulfate reductase cytochrome b subunit
MVKKSASYLRSMSTTDQTKLAVLGNDIQYIKDMVKEIRMTLDGEYVRKSEFEPVQRIVYGLVGLVLVTVIGGILSLVIGKQS